MFHKGDRIKVVYVSPNNGHFSCDIKVGDTGIVLSDEKTLNGYRIKFDRNINGHDCDKQCMLGFGQKMLETEIELIEIKNILLEQIYNNQ